MMFETISSRDLEDYINNQQAMIIDLREPKDYRQRHIGNAVNIPYEILEERYRMLPTDKMIILYCERGSTSMIAAKFLSERGYQAKTVIGGIHSYKKAMKKR